MRCHPIIQFAGSPTMNGVSKRQNMSLKDMVRSMISHSTLPDSLQGEALMHQQKGVAQVCTYLDIAYITRMLGRYLTNLRLDHWKAAKWVMRYLQRTKYCILMYRRLDQLEIIGYTDSNFGGCQDNIKSMPSYIQLLARSAISWKSAKQSLVASSTMATEFKACYEASNSGIWLWNFVRWLRVMDSIERPLRLFCNHKSAVYLPITTLSR